MKTFAQFKAWMKDYQAWEKFVENFKNKYAIDKTLEAWYNDHIYYPITCAFDWGKTPEGYDYWIRIVTEWTKFCKENDSNLQESTKPDYDQYDFIVSEKPLAVVNMPEEYTTCQLGFVQTTLEKKYPDCIVKTDEKHVYAFKRIWDLKKI